MPFIIAPRAVAVIDEKELQIVWDREIVLYIVIVSPEYIAWGDARC